MTSNTSFVGKTAMEEVLELFLMTVETDRKSVFSVTTDVLQATAENYLIAIKTALEISEMMVFFVDMQNTEEVQAILGSLVMG